MQSVKARYSVKLLSAILLSVLAAFSFADRELTSADVQAWLDTTEQLMPMQEAFAKMGESKTIADKYTEEEFRALAPEKQDEVMDEMLRQEGIYDQIYPVLNQFKWKSAGEYMRVSSRLGLAIAAHMRAQLLASVPEDQRQQMESIAKPVNANPADVKVIDQNWAEVSQFMSKYLQAPQ